MLIKIITSFLLILLTYFESSNGQAPFNDPNIQVGVYYFGGWQHFPNLRLKDKSPSPGSILMDSFPSRKPLRGWYDDRKSVIDEEVKNAVRYGINYFAFLWYYPEALTPERNKLNAPLYYFLKSKVPERKRLKFCIVYTNHNHSTGFGITSESDWRRYSEFWIGLMNHRDYYRVSLSRTDTVKPFFIIWSPKDFHEQWSSFPGGAKAILEDLRGKALKKGLPGINIAGCWDQTGSKEIFVTDGYDIITEYNFQGAGAAKAGEAGRYDSLALGHKPCWDSMAALGKPIIPVITSGWDPRPWPGTAKGSPYYPDRTPKKFKIFCRLARDWIGSNEKSVVVPKTVLIYAWNELGEGGYILPTVGEGYSYLKAIKEVFGKENSSRK